MERIVAIPINRIRTIVFHENLPIHRGNDVDDTVVGGVLIPPFWNVIYILSIRRDTKMEKKISTEMAATKSIHIRIYMPVTNIHREGRLLERWCVSLLGDSLLYSVELG